MTYAAPRAASTHLAQLLAEAHAARVAYYAAVSRLQAELDAVSSGANSSDGWQPSAVDSAATVRQPGFRVLPSSKAEIRTWGTPDRSES